MELMCLIQWGNRYNRIRLGYGGSLMSLLTQRIYLKAFIVKK